MDHDETFDEIPWGGLALSHADGMLAGDLAPPLIGAHLLYRVRRHLQEYRAPMSGLRGSYREGSGQTLAESVLGTERRAWKLVDPGNASGRPYSARRFRRRLSQFLMGVGSTTLGTTEWDRIPMGVRCMFTLPEWDRSLEESTALIYLRLGRRIVQWRAGTARGPRPPDPIKWMKNNISHPSREPLCATREELSYAVAHATHVALASGYTYAMRELVKQVQPTLSAVERDMFSLYHLTTDFIGIPLHALRRDYFDLVSPVIDSLLRGSITRAEAVQKSRQILEMHSLLKEDAAEQDRTRKRASRAKKRAQAQRGRLRRQSHRKQ